MKTASTNKKIREIISMITDGTLIPRPEFQRRLVWTRDDKNNFIDTILKEFPFPEIYLADGEVDVATGRGNQLLVDGQQRVSTIVQYFQGDPLLKLTTVLPYSELHPDDKRKFLQYDVSVRDLGNISRDQIIEVFKRINATKYSLTDIEINNALYVGKLKKYAEKFAESDFFKDKPTFNSLDFKRMGDLRFALLIICTMLCGYFNRDDMFEEILDRYNDDFPLEDQITARIEKVTNFILECGFPRQSRIWKKADMFTAFIELDSLLNLRQIDIQPGVCINSIEKFYSNVDEAVHEAPPIAGIYYNAAVQASNDKQSRIKRGIILEGVLTGCEEGEILNKLREQGLYT